MTFPPADRDPSVFVRSETALSPPSLVPEIRLHLATEVTALWQATEAALEASGLPPPFWAFAWPGGQALARHILDHPDLVRGRRVLDFAAGSGIVAIAAAKAGAASVTAVEIDAFAVAAITLNAEANGVSVAVGRIDPVGTDLPDIDIVLAGDICYERPMAERVTAWLRTLVGTGRTVMIGDPGRAYLPREGLRRVACYAVPTSLELEDRAMRETTLWMVDP